MISLTGLIISLETSGRVPSGDVLEKLNVVLTIINGATILAGPMDERVLVNDLVLTSPSMTGLVIYHRRKVPFVVHVISRYSPEQTDAILEGEISIVPV